MRHRDAVRWYREGEAALSHGHASDAVDRLRRAATRDPNRAAYSLPLANALTQAGKDQSAEQVLSDLRDETPEDPDVNLQLGRRYRCVDCGHVWRPQRRPRKRR